MEQSKGVQRLNNAVKTIEKYIIKFLIGLMTLVLVLATLQLGYLVITSILSTEVFVLDMDIIMDLFGAFLLVLIGIELLDTIKVYFKKHDVHVEVVMLVALIAVARKIILMDYSSYSGLEVLGIAGTVIALALGYYLIKKAGGCGFWPNEKETVKDMVVEETEFDPENNTKLTERKKVLKHQTIEGQKEPDMHGNYTGPKDEIVENQLTKHKGKKAPNTD
jgi:uncharacterized membrane protein (DUF373 family)